MRKEIEIKIKLSQDQLVFLKDWLKRNAKFLGENLITDYYLNNPQKSFYFECSKGYKEILKILRIRNSNDKYYLTFKNRNITKEGRTIDVDEYETVIQDGNLMAEILKQIGFTQQIKLEKNRSVYLYKEFEIVIDEIEKLGTFVEIELKKDEADGIAKIHEFLKNVVGIKEFIEFDRGYICMALNPEYDFGRKVKL